MRQAEQRLWDTMKRNRPRHVWMERVENLMNDGDPDVNVYSPNKVCFVELKAPIAPASPQSLLLRKGDVRLSQINWHLKAATMNLNHFFLLRDSLRSLFLIPGGYIAREPVITTARTKELSIASTWTEIWRILA